MPKYRALESDRPRVHRVSAVMDSTIPGLPNEIAFRGPVSITDQFGPSDLGGKSVRTWIEVQDLDALGFVSGLRVRTHPAVIRKLSQRFIITDTDLLTTVCMGYYLNGVVCPPWIECRNRHSCIQLRQRPRSVELGIAPILC